ncbi:MAG: prepilin-type N-terminal cleavage/methylation domain-containing protein [Pseudomonadota bacterium]
MKTDMICIPWVKAALKAVMISSGIGMRVNNRTVFGSRLSVIGVRQAPSFQNPGPITEHRAPEKGFTLVELMAAVAVIAVGMVFILGAFSQCVSSLTTAEHKITANFLLNAKIWEEDIVLKENNGSEAGEWSEAFKPPYENFNWTHVVRDGVSAGDFGNESLFVQENLNEEAFTVSWTQGKAVKDVSVTRLVKRKKKE